MKHLQLLTLEDADHVARDMQATTAIDYYPKRGDPDIFSVHYFLDDGLEIAMYHPLLANMQVFEPPRGWGQDMKEACGKPRSLQGLVPVKELIGEALDYAVGKANGWIDYPENSIEQGDTWHCNIERAPFGKIINKRDYTPSTDWYIGGPIIESEKISTRAGSGKHSWFATKCLYAREESIGETGPTVLVAAMRCYVASKLGDSVCIPKGLLK